MLCKQRERKTNHSEAGAAWSGKAPGIVMEKESVWCLQHSQIQNYLARWGNEQSSSCKAGGFFFSYFGTKPAFVFVFALETVQALFDQEFLFALSPLVLSNAVFYS